MPREDVDEVPRAEPKDFDGFVVPPRREKHPAGRHGHAIHPPVVLPHSHEERIELLRALCPLQHRPTLLLRFRRLRLSEFPQQVRRVGFLYEQLRRETGRCWMVEQRHVPPEKLVQLLKNRARVWKRVHRVDDFCEEQGPHARRELRRDVLDRSELLDHRRFQAALDSVWHKRANPPQVDDARAIPQTPLQHQRLRRHHPVARRLAGEEVRPLDDRAEPPAVRLRDASPPPGIVIHQLFAALLPRKGPSRVRAEAMRFARFPELAVVPAEKLHTTPVPAPREVRRHVHEQPREDERRRRAQGRDPPLVHVC
mmetsp:Transcript_14244/g.33170  ORF Transcript_14244/g.33170 Transcript_14244/m.33170 type:complete len:311 (+) Transcript_14244:296-1228(+)